MKKLLLSALAFCLALGISAQDKKDPELKLTLRNGDSYSGTVKIAKVTLTTDYGKLDIPIKNVTSIDIGLTYDKATEDKVIALVKQLSNTSEDMRRDAYKELTGMSIKAIPAISDFIYSQKYVPGNFTDYTPEGALTDLKATHNVDDDFTTKDVVNIDYTYSMGGVVDFKSIELKGKYGTQNIPKEEIKHIDVIYTPGDGGDMVFTLYASKNISSNSNGGWLKTGIQVKSGQKLMMNSSGQIVLASLSNNKYNPDGKVVGSSTTDEESDVSDYDGSEYESTYPQYGQVVYRIGEYGTTMKAGAKYNGTVTSSGMLYISIYETIYNSANTGTYTVKITLK
ncbi:MAG: hypothetical protein AB1458_01775 [Bacteroidota bacterium]